jgi:AcrR family transcriptional regulator
MSSVDPPTRRPYDARRRRERAEEERRATRNRVIDAATRLFVTNGYRGTTMADIAREAGVAMQSVYSAGRSKADLLHVAVDRAVAGDDQPVLFHERGPAMAVTDETDPVRQVQLMANLICDVQQRSEPIQTAYREAAAVDAHIAASVEAAHRRRHEAFGAIMRTLPASRLRQSHQDAVDTVWAIASTEVFQLLRTVREWSWDQIREWLERTLVDVLLVPDTVSGRRRQDGAR